MLHDYDECAFYCDACEWLGKLPMEGPSIFLATEQLAPFIDQQILAVDGNSTIAKERLQGEKILAIVSHGKQLFFQCEGFALRVHFLMYGTFQATIDNVKVTGDYSHKERPARLAFQFKNGHLEMYNCSVRFIESRNVLADFDLSTDIMSKDWNKHQAFTSVLHQKDSEIADVLLDQNIFSGVGNIIKNEVLWKNKTIPTALVKDLSGYRIKKIIDTTREYVFQFYEWRKKFELKNHYQVYRQSFCKKCGTKVKRRKTGRRERVSFICEYCQK